MLLLLVTAVAAGARVWYLSACADNGQNEGPVQVQDGSPVLTQLPPGELPYGRARPTELDALVYNLKEHQWFGSPAPLASMEERTAHVSPGYPWLLYWLQLSPVDLSPVERTMRWLQCGLGTLTAIFYFLFAYRAFGNRLVATLTGLFCALHPYWIINTAEINDGVLATFLLAACLYFGQRGCLSGGAFASLLFGLGLAALALVRAALLPFGVVALLGFLWRCRSINRGWLCALLAFLGFVNGLATWTFRNYKQLGDIIPIVDSAYLHLWMGNNQLSTGGPQSDQTILNAIGIVHGQDIETQLKPELAGMPQKDRYARIGKDVLEQIQGNPAEVFKHRLQALCCFVFGEEWFKVRATNELSHALWRSPSQNPDMPELFRLFYPTALYGSLFVMLVFGFLGWRWTYGWRHEMPLMALATIWIPLPYILSHAEALTGPRLPLDGVLLCYAAFALACFLPSHARELFNPSAPKGEAQS
jgi:4-amino-4-deoxy-L-arabinose transferase-like glycosyltransferase